MTTMVADHVQSLEEVLRRCWSRDTSADPARWSPENAAWGQCAVTALVVQDMLGGELLRCESPGGSHYWNRLSDGTELDFTRVQFAGGFTPTSGEVRGREYVLSFRETRRRYRRLRARVERMQDP
jgi:hypothetical protein